MLHYSPYRFFNLKKANYQWSTAGRTTSAKEIEMNGSTHFSRKWRDKTRNVTIAKVWRLRATVLCIFASVERFSGEIIQKF